MMLDQIEEYIDIMDSMEKKDADYQKIETESMCSNKIVAEKNQSNNIENDSHAKQYVEEIRKESKLYTQKIRREEIRRKDLAYGAELGLSENERHEFANALQKIEDGNTQSLEDMKRILKHHRLKEEENFAERILISWMFFGMVMMVVMAIVIVYTQSRCLVVDENSSVGYWTLLHCFLKFLGIN